MEDTAQKPAVETTKKRVEVPRQFMNRKIRRNQFRLIKPFVLAQLLQRLDAIELLMNNAEKNNPELFADKKADGVESIETTVPDAA